MEARKHAKIKCSLCGEEFFVKEKEEHKKSEKHTEKLLNYVFCHFCKKKLPREEWDDHKKSPEHLEEEGKTKFTCDICKEKFVSTEKEKHLETEVHRRAVAEHQKKIQCTVCNEEIVSKDWRQHAKSDPHLEAQKKQKIKCNLCSEEFFYPDKENHKETEKHKKAIEKRDEEEREKIEAKKHKDLTPRECTVCNEKFLPIKWDDHKDSTNHIKALQQKEEEKKDLKKEETAEKDMELKNKEMSKPETYFLAPRSEENQSYINTLATFVAVRFVLYTKKDFKLSINNDAWKSFGDIVFEFPLSEKTEVVALRCKKTETRDSYDSLVLSAETGRLSLKVNYEMMKELDKKEDVTFILHTVSNLTMEHCEFEYDDLDTWEEEGKQLWKKKKIEVKKHRSKKTDFFNSTNDVDNVVAFINDELGVTLKKFRMYFNQKLQSELKFSINEMIESVLNTPANISGDLVRFVEKKFKTTKPWKKNQMLNKMTRGDFLTKIAELLLVPFWVTPTNSCNEQLELWNDLTQQFDIVFVKSGENLVEKVYSAINYILHDKVEFVVEASNINIKKVEDEKLRWKLYDTDNDRSLQFLYLTLWKTTLVPMVVKLHNEKELDVVYNVVTFLNSKNYTLKLVAVTDLACDYHPKNVDVFRDLSQLNIPLKSGVFKKILDEEIKILNFTVSLNLIYQHNKDFLKKITSDVLLNIFSKTYNFVDAMDVPLTKEITEDTLVLDDDHLEKVKNLLGSEENVKGFSFLVNVKEEVRNIQIPPDLFMPIKSINASRLSPSMLQVVSDNSI